MKYLIDTDTGTCVPYTGGVLTFNNIADAMESCLGAKEWDETVEKMVLRFICESRMVCNRSILFFHAGAQADTDRPARKCGQYERIHEFPWNAGLHEELRWRGLYPEARRYRVHVQ